ncbi:MAG: glycosyltransferase family 4 protein [Chloroflexi bacterium]|nr:glycosyltransferase family 4 protein [Chloroflexota bacterium]
MRIGLIVYGDLSYTSGGFLYDRMLVERLRASGHVVEIISLPWRDYLRHVLDNFNDDLFLRLARLSLDVLIQDELNHPSLFLTNRRIQKELGAPILSIVHHLRSRERHPAGLRGLYEAVERVYLRGLDAAICVSQTTCADVNRLTGERLPTLLAQPGGDRWADLPDGEEVRARTERPGPLRLVFVGNIIPRKGLHTLIEAVAGLPEDCCRLAIVGHLDTDLRYARRLVRLVGRHGLEGRVEFLGALDEEALGALLRSSDVLAVPSSYEGFGIVYLEGMAFGLPAIGSRQGAAGETIVDGVCGFLVDYENVNELALHIRRLSSDRKMLSRMSLAAQERFAARPRWADSMKSIENFVARWGPTAIIGAS